MTIHQIAPGAPVLVPSNRTVTVSATQARSYGVPATGAEATFTDVVGDIWIEQVLEGQWIVAGRMVPDDRGVPVVAELRIFPFEATRPDDFEGRWNAELFGMKARGVPRGGLPASVVRHKAPLQVTRYEQFASAAMTAIGQVASISDSNAIFAREIQAAGFDLQLPIRWPAGSRSGPRPKGRPATTDLNYARMARAYVIAVEAGRNPVPELLQQRFGKTAAAVKSMIARARPDFLTEAPKHGKRGGSLTEKATAVLAAQSTLQRIATDSKTARSKAPQARVAPTKNARQSSKRKKRA